MAADLHIHVLEGMDEDVVKRFCSNQIGSKWEKCCSYEEREAHFSEDLGAIGGTPSVWIGEVSWLKAALFDDDTYIPETVEEVTDIIGEDFPIIDDAMIEQITQAFELPNRSVKEGGVYDGKGYAIADVAEVVDFLRSHIGKKAFTVSW